MSTDRDLKNLNELLDKIEEAAGRNNEQISLGNILDVVGRRSFGPLLLVTGIIPIAPIPGIPTIIGAIVILISVQMLFQKNYFWLPDWILNRSLKPDKLTKMVDWLRRPARFIDGFMKPRLTRFSTGFATYVIAGTCILIAAVMPLMEMVPFSAVGAGAALAVFGLSLITRDGLLSLIAFAVTALTATLVISSLL